MGLVDNDSNHKPVIIFSWNPIPTPEYPIVSAMGIRAYKTALGLLECGLTNVTVAISEGFPQSLKEVDGIRVCNWKSDEKSIKRLINSFNTVIVPLGMGNFAEIIGKAASQSQRIILDAFSPYAPLSVLSSTTEKEGLENSKWFMYDVESQNRALANFDYIIVANENQRHLYLGMLFALGNIYPASKDVVNRFITYPVGYDVTHDHKSNKDPYIEIDKHSTEVKRILWFGGLYPWFDMSAIIDVFSRKEIARSAHLYIVGAYNPTIKDETGAYGDMYTQVLKYAKEKGVVDKSVFFQDWVPYSEYMDWLSSCDLGITLNADSVENIFSWRNRLTDYVAASTPILTNGGDPLGELIISHNAGVKTGSSAEEIAASLKMCIENDKRLELLARNMKRYRSMLENSDLSKDLASILVKDEVPPRVEDDRINKKYMKIFQKSPQQSTQLIDNKKEIDYLNNRIEELRPKAQGYDQVTAEYKSLTTNLARFPYGYLIATKRIASRLRSKLR